MKLRTLCVAVVAALALVAGSAQAQDAGWDTKYGVLFTVPNPFGGSASATATAGTGGTAIAVGGTGSSNANFLNSYDGMVGFQYNLAPERALRFGVNLMRSSEGVTKDTNAAGQVLQTLPTWTSQYAIGLEGQYMMRLAPSAVAPYFGAGLRVDFSQSNLKGDENTTYGGLLTKYDNYDRTWSAGLMATGGLEWRLSKVIAIFAEYRADLLLYSSTKGETKVTPPAAATTKTKTEESHFLNLSTGLAHGGQIGLVAFF